MVFNAILEKLRSPVWTFCIYVPRDIAVNMISLHSRRVICKFNNSFEFHCALMSDGEGKFFININQEIRKIFKADTGSEFEVELKPDFSKYGLPMPTEFQEVLNQDEEGAGHFEMLTPGKKRNLLFLAGKPKQSEIRLNKALIIIDYLKRSNGKLNFRELNEALKNSRF